jgi:hypothetical protein
MLPVQPGDNLRPAKGNCREFKALAAFRAEFSLTLSRAALQLRVYLGRE